MNPNSLLVVHDGSMLSHERSEGLLGIFNRRPQDSIVWKTYDEVHSMSFDELQFSDAAVQVSSRVSGWKQAVTDLKFASTQVNILVFCEGLLPEAAQKVATVARELNVGFTYASETDARSLQSAERTIASLIPA